MSVTDLQTQGRQAYRKGDYAKALQCFDRALGRQQTVKLYDCRASVNVKLHNLQAALQDAKSAINAGREDPTGYLRAGKVLVRMDKPKVALEICAHGLKQVRHVGQGYEQLKKTHDELQTRLAPNNSVDPLTVLPRELATVVLAFLTFRQRIAACRVSKGWKNFIHSEPMLWQNLDLARARKKVTTRFISTAINSGKKKVTAATLHRLYDFDTVLKALARHCPLEQLTLIETGLQCNNLVEDLEKATQLRELRILRGTDLADFTLMEVAAQHQGTLEVLLCEYIRSMDFEPWGQVQLCNLRSIDLTLGVFQNLNSGLKELASNMPLLEEFRMWSTDPSPYGPNGDAHIVDLRACTKLHHLDIHIGWAGARQLLVAPSIRTLRLSTTRNHRTGFWPDTVVAPDFPDQLRLTELPYLEDFLLDVQSTALPCIASQLSTNPLNPAEPPLSKLKALYLRNPEVDPTQGVSLLTERTKDIEELALTDCTALDDATIYYIVKDFKKLQVLNVSGTKITGAGVKDIVLLGHVDELILNDCYYLARDAVDWARSVGVKVEHKKLSDDLGGAKVRE